MYIKRTCSKGNKYKQQIKFKYMSKEKILEDFFDFGYSERTEQLIPGRDLKITFRNIGIQEQFELEQKLKNLTEEPARYAMQQYALHLLARTLIKWGDKSFDTPEQWEQFLGQQSVVILDKAVKLQQKFEKEVKEALEVDSVMENFSPTDVQIDASRPSPEELNPESEEA